MHIQLELGLNLYPSRLNKLYDLIKPVKQMKAKEIKPKPYRPAKKMLLNHIRLEAAIIGLLKEQPMSSGQMAKALKVSAQTIRSALASLIDEEDSPFSFDPTTNLYSMEKFR